MMNGLNIILKKGLKKLNNINFERRTILARSKDYNLILTCFGMDKEIKRIGVK
jgi:hypothetical protein